MIAAVPQVTSEPPRLTREFRFASSNDASDFVMRLRLFGVSACYRHAPEPSRDFVVRLRLHDATEMKPRCDRQCVCIVEGHYVVSAIRKRIRLNGVPADLWWDELGHREIEPDYWAHTFG